MANNASIRRAGAAATAAAAFAAVVFFGAASALAEPAPFKGHLNDNGRQGGLACEQLVDGGDTVARFCKGDPALGKNNDHRPLSWDGQPLSVDLTLPAEGDGDDPWPLVVMLHGYAGNKHEWETDNPGSTGLNNVGLAKRGYAALTLSTRGFGSSCGSVIGAFTEAFSTNGTLKSGYGTANCPKNPSCAKSPENPDPPDPCSDLSLVHLADARYEARDVQALAGYLVDDGIAEPGVGILGESYGGGQTLILARLKDRIMLEDGTTIPWRSPGTSTDPDEPNGQPLQIAAAGAEIPWSDLANALMPNGRSLDDADYTATTATDPVGVKKDDWVMTLYAGGLLAGSYPPVGCPGLPEGIACPDLTGWLSRLDQGEPYDDGTGEAWAVAEEVRKYHSAMGVWDAPGIGGPPAPTVIANGWTDDLFPPIEGLRFYNRAVAEGGKAFFGLGDFGHSRGQGKDDAEGDLREDVGSAWLDHFLKGIGSEPQNGVRAYTQTCPKDAPSGGPFDAPDWGSLAEGNVTLTSAAPQTVDASGGRQDLAEATDPKPFASETGVGATGDACAVTTPSQSGGVATYKFPAATGDGYTMLGMPTIEADITTNAADQVDGELAGRLWDLDVNRNTQTLVSKGVYRLVRNQSGKIVFQLQGNGWKFEPGHKPKVELLGRDDYYDPSSESPGSQNVVIGSFRRSNNLDFTVDINSVMITLPTREPLGILPTETPTASPTPSEAGAVSSTGEPAAESDSSPPTVKIKSPRGNRAYRLHGGSLTLKGSAADGGAGVDRVRYALALRNGGRCRYVTKSGRTSKRSRSCDKPRYLKATGTTEWKAKIKKRLRRGDYVLLVKARDSAGNWSKARKVVFKLR